MSRPSAPPSHSSPSSHSSHAAPAAPAVEMDDDDEFNLAEYRDILLDQKWLVVGMTALALAIGAAYGVLSTPVYRSNLLVQVEDPAPDANKGFLAETSSLFDVKTPATGEIQVVRSRLVLGAAVEQTQLHVSATPRYLPLIGPWLARRADTLSQPGFLGMGGYVSGTEQIAVARFDVPPALEDTEPFAITAQGEGRYSVRHPLLDAPLEGVVGVPLQHTLPDGPLELLVQRMDALPGAAFDVSVRSRLRTIEELQGRLNVSEQGRETNVINVALDDSNRQRLTRVLNAIGEQYVRQNVERRSAEAEKTLAFLEQQLPEFQAQLEGSEDAFTRFRNQHGTVAFDEEAKGVLTQSVELQTRLLDLQQQRREVASRFTDRNQNVQTLDRQIGAVQSELGALNRRITTMPIIQRDALRLERDVEVNSTLYQSLKNNALELRLVKEGKVGNVRLLDGAVQPKEPVRPQKGLVLALAGLLGLIGGVALAIVRARVASGIRAPQEIEAHTGLAVYATIPHSPEQTSLDARVAGGKPGLHLLAAQHADSTPVEALRSLRVALKFALLEAPNNRILVTGTTPGVGKSFISTNFAAVLAQSGKRVLLLDADLRRGHLHKFLGLRREAGLAEVLTGELALQQVIHEAVMPGLDVLATGELPANPADLLESAAFVQTLEQLSAQYDLVVIDAPPVLVAADAAAVAPACGVVLLVARDGQTHLGEINESNRRLNQAGAATSGVIYNGLDLGRRHAGAFGYRLGGYRYAEYKYTR